MKAESNEELKEALRILRHSYKERMFDYGQNLTVGSLLEFVEKGI